jgi:simple sugar transport system ATP-binding protein
VIASGPPGADPSLAARGITKRFGDLVAVDHVDFDVRAGEVHALIGENGAGKSTLMSVLYGLHRPDGGSILLHGRETRFTSCADAMRAGIGMVFQHFLLIDRFTVAENVLLGREPERAGFLDTSAALAEVAALVQSYQFPLDPAARVESLNVGARQQVELLKVLERDARIVILDEPTAALSPAETKSLFAVVRRLRDEGRAVILIAHKLKEVLALADRVTVLRRGKVTGSLPIEQADANTLATMMVGRAIDLDAREPRRTVSGGVALTVRGLRVARDDGAPAVRDVDLDVRAGEILGVAGVEGNGQMEFAEALYGLRPVTAGRVTLEGDDITFRSAAARRAAGMRYVPADRQREGLVLGFDTVENALLGDQRRTRQGAAVNLRLGRERADAINARYAMAGYAPSRPAAAYSGGTQQKLIVGREMTDDARTLICVAPTRGVDVGAAATIHRRLRDVRDRGASVVLVSYDLDEIRALSDRIVVFSEGRISGSVMPAEADDVTMGNLMTGATAHG